MEQAGWLSSDFLASREAHLDPILSDFNLNKKPINLSQHMARVAGDNVYCSARHSDPLINMPFLKTITTQLRP